MTLLKIIGIFIGTMIGSFLGIVLYNKLNN